MGLDPYRSFINALAFQQVNIPVEEPPLNLGIGETENMGSLPLTVKYPSVFQPAIMPNISQSPIEKVYIDGSGTPGTGSAFPYLGTVSEGF